MRETRPAPPLPAGFKSGVWRRLDAQPAPWVDRIVELLLRPRLAAAALAVLVVVGAGIGAVDAKNHSSQSAQERYIASITPWRGE